MQRPGEAITIHPTTVESYWSRERLPSPKEQADDLVLWIGDNQPDPATNAITKQVALDAWIGAALSDRRPGNAIGLIWLVSASREQELFEHHFELGDASFRLTLTGWEKYSALKQVRVDSRVAFMAMKFGDAELNSVVDGCFRLAVKRAGFELRILTDRQEAGLIDNQMRAALLAARFVIADLTHGSFGAYWEAGFADGRGLPVIYTCRRAEWERAKSHFDTNHMTTVLWNTANLKPSEDELTAIIRTTLRAEARQTDQD
jgi:hypothetical protein